MATGVDEAGWAHHEALVNNVRLHWVGAATAMQQQAAASAPAANNQTAIRVVPDLPLFGGDG